jgi:hypothetical protein
VPSTTQQSIKKSEVYVFRPRSPLVSFSHRGIERLSVYQVSLLRKVKYTYSALVPQHVIVCLWPLRKVHVCRLGFAPCEHWGGTDTCWLPLNLSPADLSSATQQTTRLPPSFCKLSLVWRFCSPFHTETLECTTTNLRSVVLCVCVCVSVRRYVYQCGN